MSFIVFLMSSIVLLIYNVSHLLDNDISPQLTLPRMVMRPVGNYLTFGTGANALIGVGEIIWCLKFRCLRCAICDLKNGVGEIIWDLRFLVYHF